MGFIIIPGIDISDADAALADVLNPKTFYSVAAPRKTGSMPTVALVAGSNAYPQGYHVGDALGLSHVDTNLDPALISAGVNIFGVVGTLGYFDRWYPTPIDLSHGEIIIPVDQSQNAPALIDSSHRQNYLDDVANYIKRIVSALAITDGESITTIDQSHDEPVAIISEGGAQLLIAGAVADDGGVETDETAAARDATANDMTLLPAAPAVGDAYMIGSTVKANRFWLNIGTAGAGNWTLVMKYWNGAAWANCVDEVETSAQFMSSGLKYWQHTPQGDWALSVIQGMNLYWVRIELTNFVNLVTQPLGTQAWSEIFGS